MVAWKCFIRDGDSPIYSNRDFPGYANPKGVFEESAGFFHPVVSRNSGILASARKWRSNLFDESHLNSIIVLARLVGWYGEGILFTHPQMIIL
jgi:hypothetical protein